MFYLSSQEHKEKDSGTQAMHNRIYTNRQTEDNGETRFNTSHNKTQVVQSDTGETIDISKKTRWPTRLTLLLNDMVWQHGGHLG